LEPDAKAFLISLLKSHAIVALVVVARAVAPVVVAIAIPIPFRPTGIEALTVARVTLADLEPIAIAIPHGRRGHAGLAPTVVCDLLDTVESFAVTDSVTLTKRAAVVLPIAILASISTVGAPVVAIAIDPELTPMSCIVLATGEPVTMPGVVGTTLELAVVIALVVVMTMGCPHLDIS
jgi:hypothetical protein